MQFDIMVNGRKMGTAKVSVEISGGMKGKHAISEHEVLRVLKTGEPRRWYCMGDVEIRPSTPENDLRRC